MLTNQDLEKLVETNDKWIMERTGIRERHIAAPEMATSDMAIEAARCALAYGGVDATMLARRKHEERREFQGPHSLAW